MSSATVTGDDRDRGMSSETSLGGRSSASHNGVTAHLAHTGRKKPLAFQRADGAQLILVQRLMSSP